MKYTQDEWNNLNISEQAEAWERMSDPERRAVRPDWKPLRLELAKEEAPEVMAAQPRPVGGEICGDCGTVGKSRRFTPGSVLVEIVLWLFFLFPGFVYSVWRLASTRYGCPKCGGKMIGLDTPRGQALYKELAIEIHSDNERKPLSQRRTLPTRR